MGPRVGKMQQIVKVTRRGQTTIPREFRKKYSIREGDELLIEDSRDGLVIKVVPKLYDLAGIDAKYGRVKEVKQELERLREEF